MLVVAFDGVLFDTLEVRATAVANALAAEGLPANRTHVQQVLPSLSLAEAVRAVAAAVVHGARVADETAIDLAVFRAERAVGELVVRGATLNVGVRERIHRAAAVTRIVVRADSSRAQAQELLSLAGLDEVVSMLRCSDDGPPSDNVGTHHASAHRSYDAILKRMAGNASLLGERSSVGIALESSVTAQRIARTFGFETPAPA